MKSHLLHAFAVFAIITLLYHSQIQAQTQTSTPTLWGMTHFGGAKDSGTVFSYTISKGTDTDLHNFNGGIEGAYPYGSLIQAKNDSLLYGMVSAGGTNKYGEIFSYTISTRIYADLYDFKGDTDGENPYGSLLQVNDSMLYGMTAYGGANNNGIIFSYNILTGKEIILHSFGNDTDGRYPYGALIKASNGLLYGMTELGGVYDGGIIFSFNDTTNTETVLHEFNPFIATDGYAPNGSLIQANNGLLYGMTNTGGIKINPNNSTNNTGVIFSYNILTGTETDIHNFGIGTDGEYPFGSLIQASNGLFYGMTSEGGVDLSGTIFSFNDTTGTETDIHDFGPGTTDGNYPQGSLIQTGNGLLYGMTYSGGATNLGTIFNYTIPAGIETDIHDFTGADGENPFGDLIGIDTATIYTTPLLATICEGSSITLIANGASTYTWAPATGLSATTGDSIIASPTTTVTYAVAGLKDGRTYITTVTVTVNAAPVITVNTLLSPICNGESVTLTASDGITYTWTPETGLNVSTGDSVIASPATTTTYYVTGTGAFGCTSTDSDVVTIISSPIEPTFHQHGDTLISSAQYNNQWYRNDTLLSDTSQYLIITSLGEYWVSVSNEANGCSASSDSMKITQITGINQLTVDNGKLTVYPNPTGGKVFITINSSVGDMSDWNLQITDVLGRPLYSMQLLNPLKRTFEIDLSNLAGGMYFITVLTKTGRTVVPVVKQNG